MKKLFLSMALMVSLTMNAKSDAEVVGAVLGSTYEETQSALKTKLGEPSVKSANQLVYMNKYFEGMKADRVEIGFQELKGVEIFNQARFYFYCANKSAAIVKMKSLAQKMESQYQVSYDEEAGGVAFYKGGRSPLGIGSLFTIFVSPYQGKWTCQLRYGKFQYK